MAEKKPPASLTFRIIVALGAGAAVGILLNLVGAREWVSQYLVNGLFHVVGTIFLASLKLVVVPLVFFSLTVGVGALKDVGRLGRIGGTTMALYIVTTAAAISLALGLAVLIGPGLGFNLKPGVEFKPTVPPPLTKVLIDIFPTNPVQAMAEGNMLQIIVFACLFGLAISGTGEGGKRVLALFDDLNDAVLKMVALLMRLAPYGVFCLIAAVFATQGFAAFAPLLKYFGVVLLALAVQLFVVYPALLKLLSGLDPLVLLRRFREVFAVAFSTSSSSATLPVTLEAVEHKLGVDNSLASFTIPLGATINMDGTAIMQGVATAFIAQAYGIQLGLSGFVMVVVTATLASIGTAGVPGAGLVMLAMVLKQVNLPVEGIALIIGVDRLLDMSRTVVNVTGDAVVTCIVAKREGLLNQDVYYGRASRAGQGAA